MSLLVILLVALAPQLCWAADRYDEHEGFILASFIDKDWFNANSVRTAQRGAATTAYVCLEYTRSLLENPKVAVFRVPIQSAWTLQTRNGL